MSATNRGAKRVEQDAYNTPQPAVESLLSVLRIPYTTSFLEPCRGKDAIYGRVDCFKKLYAEIKLGIDYLKLEMPHPVDLVITNPPFELALEFLQKSLLEARTVVYLLRLNFLGSQERRDFWKINRPSHLLALSERPCFVWTCPVCKMTYHPGEQEICFEHPAPARLRRGTDATDYGWFCWDREGLVQLEPGVHVL